MADSTQIEWSDATWNVITGCKVKTKGCTNCYAMRLAGTRLQHHPSRAGLTQPSAAGPVWNGEVRFNEPWLRQPLTWKRGRLIFVVAHGDLFYEGVPDEWIDKVFAVMAMAPQHTFQVLTKRSARMRDYMKRFAADYGPIEKQILALGGNPIEALTQWPLPNMWMGVSAEDQATAEERVPHLQDTPAAVRWVSAEPLLGEIRLDELMRSSPTSASRDQPDDRDSDWTYCDNALEGKRSTKVGQYDVPKIDWVVTGGESGVGARPSKTAWFRSLRDQCAKHGTAHLHKQNGNWLDDDAAAFMGSATSPMHQFSDGSTVVHVGKKKAGRHLDGVLHDQYPEVQS